MHPGTDSAIGKSDYQPNDFAAGTGGIHMPSIQPMTHAASIQVALIPPVGLTFLLIHTASGTSVFQRAEGAGIQRSVVGVHACCMLCSFCRVSGIGLGLQNIHALIPSLEKVITNQKILLLALAGYTCDPSSQLAMQHAPRY